MEFICYNVDTTKRKEVITMEILYRAFDGKVFHNADECLRHERENPLFRMWNKDGLTTDPGNALVVEILDKYDGANAFVELCESHNDMYDGIDRFTDKGVYMWDDEQYVCIPDNTLEALRHIMR